MSSSSARKQGGHKSSNPNPDRVDGRGPHGRTSSGSSSRQSSLGDGGDATPGGMSRATGTHRKKPQPKPDQSHSTVPVVTPTSQPVQSSKSSSKSGLKSPSRATLDKGQLATSADKSKSLSFQGPVENRKAAARAERRAVQEAQRKAKAERQAASGKGVSVGGTDGGGLGDSKHAHASKSSKGKSVTNEEHSGGSHHQSRAAHGQKSTRPAKITKSGSQDKPLQKQMQLFSHLPQFERELPLTKALDLTAGSIHPCIVKLGLQYSEGIICGSNARCIALLAAFKKVIHDYNIPPEKEMRRDLDATIKPYISFLSRCRPLSVSMGNAIKHLKLKISNISPDVSEAEAKVSLCDAIDYYLKEKIQLADEAISQFCQKVISDGDVILVHAHSSIVQRVLMDAHKLGTKFRVIVVDSRPKLEGRHCLRQLVRSGIKCSYIFINAVSYIMKEVSKVIVGAHGLLANGYVMSRVGTSLIALVAKSYNVPLLVCCETYKFCDKVQTDSFVINELGDPNDLVPIQRRQGDYLSDWKSIEALRLLNLVYDVTSPDLITMVITQVGLIPCSSVPVVLRISQELEQMQVT